MKRVTIFIGILALIALGVVAYVANQKPAPTASAVQVEEAPALLTVTPLSADVSLSEGANQAAWSVIASTSSASDGARVKTSADGRAIVSREASIVSSLDNNTEITLTFSADKKQSRFGIVAGKIWSKVARALEQDEVFEVYTPTLVAAVRGTSFGVSLDPRRSLMVSEGTVWITRRNQQTGEVSASSTIAVPAGNTVEDDGVNFLVRPTSAEDRDVWYRENNPISTNPPNPVIQNNAVITPVSQIPAPTAGSPVVTVPPPPTISSVSPSSFDPQTVSTVRISGKNLNGVTQVLLNKKSVEFSVTTVGVIVISTAEFRDGDGPYDLTVASPAGTAALAAAFTVQAVQSPRGNVVQ